MSWGELLEGLVPRRLGDSRALAPHPVTFEVGNGPLPAPDGRRSRVPADDTFLLNPDETARGAPSCCLIDRSAPGDEPKTRVDAAFDACFADEGVRGLSDEELMLSLRG